jgi:hypothetical protein
MFWTYNLWLSHMGSDHCNLMIFFCLNKERFGHHTWFNHASSTKCAMDGLNFFFFFFLERVWMAQINWQFNQYFNTLLCINMIHLGS